MTNITIRPETPADVAGVRTVEVAAFGRAAEADLVDALRRNGRAPISLVAVEGDDVVGHILFSPVTLDPQVELPLLGLAPLAVLPAKQRQGIGAALCRAGLDACRAAGCAAVIVLGDPAYYPRFGFRPAAASGFRCIYDAPADAFMVVELTSGALAGRSGTFHYAPEFGAVE